MRIAYLSLAVVFGLLSTIGSSAADIDAVLPLDTETSHLAFSLTLDGKQIASASIPFTGGTFDADIAQTGALSAPLILTDVTGEVDAGPFKIDTVLGKLSTNGLSLAIGPAAGPFASNDQDPPQVNLAGLPLSLDKGTISAFGFTLVNFADKQVNFELPTTMATLNDSLLSLHVPVDASGSKTFDIFGHHETIAYSLTGSVNFGGAVPVTTPTTLTAAIPEPSTIVLSALGGLALLMYRRRCA